MKGRKEVIEEEVTVKNPPTPVELAEERRRSIPPKAPTEQERHEAVERSRRGLAAIGILVD